MKSISYNSIVAGRLSELIGRKIVGKEWGRIGSIVRAGRPHVELTLTELEKLNNVEKSLLNLTIGLFQSLVILDKNGGDIKKRIGFFLNLNTKNSRDELIEVQKKGSELLSSLTGK